MKRVSAAKIYNDINKLFENNNRQLLKKIEDVENENSNIKKQLLLLETLITDIHNHSLAEKKVCPICNFQVNAFLPGPNFRKNAMCPNCDSLERHRASYLFLQENTNIFTENIKMLHIAPEKIFADIFMHSDNIDYLPVDLDKNNPYITEDMDIQDIKYPDNTFDFIYCSHVLEHVPNDQKAIDELHRVLKKDGEALISVPINHMFQKTYENPSINTPHLRSKYYGQHDHLRHYGLDFSKKLKKSGFEVRNDFISTLNTETIQKYGLSSFDDLFHCIK